MAEYHGFRRLSELAKTGRVPKRTLDAIDHCGLEAAAVPHHNLNSFIVR